MSHLFFSADFWFGAFLLAAYQIAKFGEIGAVDPARNEGSMPIPNLRANDFAGRFTFGATLAAFLSVTFLVYLLLCEMSPTVLKGWAHVSGAVGGEELDKFVSSVPYPLYIAAAFMGLTQPAIPIFSNLGDMQRNVFHALMGIPRRVLETSGGFAIQVFARSPTREQLGKEVLGLVSNSWLERIDPYADLIFYRHQLARLKLDDDAEIEELLKGSKRELKELIGKLLCAASLATARESGASSLARLAGDLGVFLPPKRVMARDFLAVGMLLLIGMTFLWSVIPMFDGFAARFLSAGSKWDFWPDNLITSGQYLTSHAGPMFLATGIALAAWSSGLRRRRGQATDGPLLDRVATHFERYAGLFVGVVVVIILYDVFQAFFDYGYFKETTTNGAFLTFIAGNLPFYLLHSFVSLAACFILLIHADDIEARRPKLTSFAIMSLSGVVALLALFYAVARLYYQYKITGIDGVDFAVLVVVMNVSAALLAYATVTFYCRRQVSMLNEETASLLRRSHEADVAPAPRVERSPLALAPSAVADGG